MSNDYEDDTCTIAEMIQNLAGGTATPLEELKRLSDLLPVEEPLETFDVGSAVATITATIAPYAEDLRQAAYRGDRAGVDNASYLIKALVAALDTLLSRGELAAA